MSLLGDPAERSLPIDISRTAARAGCVKGAQRRRRSAPLPQSSTSPRWSVDGGAGLCRPRLLKSLEKTKEVPRALL